MGEAARSGVDLPEPPKVKSRLGGLERRGAIGLPGLSEPQVIRHYTRLSQKNYAIDAGLYPPGSCPIKPNRPLNEKMPGRSERHTHDLQPLMPTQNSYSCFKK